MIAGVVFRPVLAGVRLLASLGCVWPLASLGRVVSSVVCEE